MIELWYENKIKIVQEDITRNSIKLMGKCAFLKNTNELSNNFDAIIDTGAHSSLIPHSIWKECHVNLYDDTFLMGIKNNILCSIPCYYGEILMMILDTKGNHTKLFKALCYLSKIDEIPIILGYHDCLEKYKLVSDYPSNSAYLKIS